MRHAPVLLVDSNADGLELYATALALAGIPSATASSVDEAISRLEKTPPRVLVTGLRLPGTAATELIARARQRADRDLFIVALSTDHGGETRRAHDAGCDLVLPVPCLPETLITQLQRALN